MVGCKGKGRGRGRGRGAGPRDASSNHLVDDVGGQGADEAGARRLGGRDGGGSAGGGRGGGGATRWREGRDSNRSSRATAVGVFDKVRLSVPRTIAPGRFARGIPGTWPWSRWRRTWLRTGWCTPRRAGRRQTCTRCRGCLPACRGHGGGEGEGKRTRWSLSVRPIHSPPHAYGLTVLF
jgi:hypothetical protein